MALASLMLDSTWDLTLDTSGNIALATETPAVGQPGSLAQDAASAIQTYLTEYYLDTTIGVPWSQQILGVYPPPPLALVKQQLVKAALGVNPDIAAAQVFLTAFSNRGATGQVQVVPVGGGAVQVASFSVTNPQGSG